MATKNEIKNLINAMEENIEAIGSAMGLDEGAGHAAKFQLAMFMMYLSASDGEIKWDEASMISDLCDLNLTPQTMSEFIRKNNIYSVEFEKNIPVSLQMVVTMDNKLLETNPDNDLDAPSLIVDTYREVAKIIMDADDDIDSNEKNDCQIYIDMLVDYVNENSLRKKASVTGFTKNTGSIIAPSKTGVSAPKKG